MKASDIVKLLILSAEIIDVLSKYRGTHAAKIVRDAARKHGVSFRQLWSRIPKKWK